MLFVGTSIIHPSTEGVFLLCNILDLLIYSNITVSTGFYLLPKDMDSTLPEMLAHADAMLYEEKQKRDKNVAKILPK